MVVPLAPKSYTFVVAVAVFLSEKFHTFENMLSRYSMHENDRRIVMYEAYLEENSFFEATEKKQKIIIYEKKTFIMIEIIPTHLKKYMNVHCYQFHGHEKKCVKQLTYRSNVVTAVYKYTNINNTIANNLLAN